MPLVPTNPKIYHIVHIDRLTSIIDDGYLWCDREVVNRSSPGTTIGMGGIKQWRLMRLLNSHSNLYVGDCVPFYFCPRSVMLYVISQANHIELSYRGGQDHIIHLEADLHLTTEWARQNNLRWAFTSVNASASYSDDWCELADLQKIDWDSVKASNWKNCKENKQAEFLIESRFPWELVARIGLRTRKVKEQVNDVLNSAPHKPQAEIITKWYY